jgi:pyrroloquinoline-quinone synthase
MKSYFSLTSLELELLTGGAMSNNPLLNQIDHIIDEYHLLKHPFYQAWNDGKLSMESLQDYATQYYHHVAAFPTYLSAVHAQTEDLETRRHILQNLIDEEAGTPNHPDLWLLFTKSLGLENKSVMETPQWAETENLIQTFKNICAIKGTATGIAALYGYESQIPEIAETKIDGLKKHYGLDSDDALNYFRVHIEADKEHSLVERKLLGSNLNKSNLPEVKADVTVVLKALWDLLSAVCTRHQIN